MTRYRARAAESAAKQSAAEAVQSSSLMRKQAETLAASVKRLTTQLAASEAECKRLKQLAAIAGAAVAAVPAPSAPEPAAAVEASPREVEPLPEAEAPQVDEFAAARQLAQRQRELTELRAKHEAFVKRAADQVCFCCDWLC